MRNERKDRCVERGKTWDARYETW